MAFVNIELTEEQREEIAKQRIKNPYGSYCDITEGIKPLYLTVDKNSRAWLAWCYQHHDTNEIIIEFIFMYENIPIYIQAEKIYKEQTIIWKITRIGAEKTLDKQFRDTLAEAFKTYAASGWPGEKNDFVEVVFNV